MKSEKTTSLMPAGRAILTLAMFPALLFTGCMKEKNLRTYTIVAAEYKTKNSVREAVGVNEAKPLKNLGSFILYNNTMYITERNEGIHVVDYSNPANPQNKGFIPVPGNTGMAIKNNMLYADCYSDLFIIRIASQDKVEFQGAASNVFSSRMNTFGYDTNAVEVIYHKRDTTVTEQQYSYLSSTLKEDSRMDYNLVATPNTGGGTSVGSSMAVVAIVNDFLYTVDHSNLNAFSISDLSAPKLTSTQQVNWNVETIFPFKDKLFIGSMSGMFIYGLSDASKPAYLGSFDHVRVCDPVIADDSFAYVTLRSGAACGGFTNQLDVLNIDDITKPTLVKSFPFTNPHGLSKDQQVLFVCDGTAGLRIVDASDPGNLVTKQTITTTSPAIDVVAHNQLAFVMLSNAIQIYTYDQQFNIQLQGTLAKQ